MSIWYNLAMEVTALRLTEARAQRLMTLRDLARAASLSESTLYHLERVLSEKGGETRIRGLALLR